LSLVTSAARSRIKNGFLCPTGQDPPENEAPRFLLHLAVAAIVVACYFVGLIIFNASQSNHHHYDGQAQLILWDPKLFLGVNPSGCSP